MSEDRVREVIDAADQHGADVFFHALDEMYRESMPRWRCLEMFARDGSLTLCRYIDLVRSVDAWELNEEHMGALSRRRPSELITGRCSYELLRECDKKFDMIVVDSPQGVYPDGEGNLHAEHFDVIPLLPRVMNDVCLVALYVNKHPYDRRDGSYGRDDYGAYDFNKWMRRRADFYGSQRVGESRALQVYSYKFYDFGWTTHRVLLTPCLEGVGLPPSFRLGLELRRV